MLIRWLYDIFSKIQCYKYRTISLMMILNDYDRILRVSKFCGENNYLIYRKSLFKIVFVQNIF